MCLICSCYKVQLPFCLIYMLPFVLALQVAKIKTKRIFMDVKSDVLKYFIGLDSVW